MTDYDSFESRVVYLMKGWVDEQLDIEDFHRANEASLTSEASLTYDEDLRANIINLEAWLRGDWSERMDEEIDIGNGRSFIPDFSQTEVRLDLRREELLMGAKQRADEDNTEIAYVLANWTLLAEKHDHVQNPGEVRSLFESVYARDDQPDDATADEWNPS